PGELAVAGFDDLPIAAEIVPALTTVRIPRRRMGEVAAGLILRRLAGEAVAEPVVDLGFELQVRASA
ncbi:MAG: substrate-binding domain-containing protein, partial [Geminicoccaceae bacterium]|nr:substrate-binding domain-containing protein [Geminicoccaceae bacterium]